MNPSDPSLRDLSQLTPPSSDGIIEPSAPDSKTPQTALPPPPGDTRGPYEHIMSVPETSGPDLSQLPPPPLPGNASPPGPSLSELPPPGFSTAAQSVTRKPRHLGLIITATAAAVVLVGAVVAALAFAPFSTSLDTAEPSAPPPTASAEASIPEAKPVTPTPGEMSPTPTPDSTSTLEVPGSGAAPIPEDATKLCVYGTTKPGSADGLGGFGLSHRI